jgi:hypothetical protein
MVRYLSGGKAAPRDMYLYAWETHNVNTALPSRHSGPRVIQNGEGQQRLWDLAFMGHVPNAKGQE